jgi:hypothetical protein
VPSRMTVLIWCLNNGMTCPGEARKNELYNSADVVGSVVRLYGEGSLLVLEST